jgi:hypothetical protein
MAFSKSILKIAMMNFQFSPGPLVTQRQQLFVPLRVALVQTLELDS